MLRRWLLLALLLAPTAAWADNAGQVLQIVGAVISLIPGGAPYGYALLVAGRVYGGVEMRREARRVTARLRAEHNATLQDRTVTVLRADPPWQVIYGRAIVGGAIVDIFGSDKSYRTEDGALASKADGLKHLVVVLAAHRCQAIHEIYIDGVPLGTLDANGYPTGGEFFESRVATRTVLFTTSVTLPETPLTVLQAHSLGGGGVDTTYTSETVTISGNTLNGPVGVPVIVNYTVDGSLGSVRVSKHLGTDTEAVDSYFNTVAPTRYTSAHGMKGLTGLCITFDLENPRFQGGPPNITADVSGALVYDWRKDSTVAGGSGSHRVNNPATWEWSENNALCTRDFLTQPYGFNADDDEVNAVHGIAAANACDALISLTVGGVTTTNQKTYTCNGAFTTDSAGSAAEATLEDLAASMAGSVVYGADWQINAGVWTAPVMTLTDDDARGPIEVVQADTPLEALFNGLRGQYMPAGAQSPADFNPPYQNTTFVTADGAELWQNITLPFTDNPARARNLARILTERNRSGQVLRFPAKIRAWPLKAGERVTLNCAEYGIVGLTYRVTDWQFDLRGGVLLTLQRDVATIWDLADAATADPTPNTDLPNPWVVPAITGLAATSGTATLLRARDGTLTSRVKLTWTALTNAYVLDGGYIEVMFLRPQQTVWQAVPNVQGRDTAAWISEVGEGEPVLVQVTAVNKYGKRGTSTLLTHTVVGKSAAPANVSGLAVAAAADGIAVSCTASPEIDHKETEFRYGASWATGTVIRVVPKGTEPVVSFVWPWPPAGAYTLRARHRDTSGNESAADASIDLLLNTNGTVTAGQVVIGGGREDYTTSPAGTVTVTTPSHVPDDFVWNTLVASLTFTPGFSGRATLLFTAHGSYVRPVAGAASARWSVQDVSGAFDTAKRDGVNVPASSTVAFEISRSQTFTVVGGVAVTYEVYANKFAPGDTFELSAITLAAVVER